MVLPNSLLMPSSWRFNFYTLWTAEVIAIIGFQAVQPFLPYYIQELGVDDLSEALIWSGYMGTVAGLAMAISSPIWGSLADHFGRKPMVVRSMLGGGVTLTLMAYVTNPEQILLVRMLHGALSGTVTACITLVSTTTPKPRLGFALGMMQGAFMLGASVGPWIGGAAIEYFGYHSSFLGAGALVLLAGICVQLWVKEDFTRIKSGKAGKKRGDFFRDAQRLLRIRPFFVLVTGFALTQFSFAVILPVVPLFLQKLAQSDNIVSVAGMIFALMGLVGAVSSVMAGKWSDRIGLKRLLLGGLLATSFFFVAQGFATTVTELGVLMILSGFASGAIRQSANVLTVRIVPEQDRGKAFGVLTSANALGWTPGPIIGGYIGAELGFQAVFFITAALFLLVAGAFWKTMQAVHLEEAG
jgi:DHA1 family multidrug resistance protein-like MFS transporter